MLEPCKHANKARRNRPQSMVSLACFRISHDIDPRGENAAQDEGASTPWCQGDTALSCKVSKMIGRLWRLCARLPPVMRLGGGKDPHGGRCVKCQRTS